MAIESTFLATLRRTMRSELLLHMVQIEQIVPGWWPTLTDLAEQLGTDRSTLNHSLRTLERKQLIARASISKGGGTFIWWVKRHPTDQPSPSSEPSWRVRDHQLLRTEYITITGREQWARLRRVPYPTLRSFLSGHQHKLRNRWTLQSTPHDIHAAE